MTDNPTTSRYTQISVQVKYPYLPPDIVLTQSPEWLSGNRNLIGNWITQPTDTILYHKQFLTVPQAFTEIGNQAQDAMVYLAAPLVRHICYTTVLCANLDYARIPS